MKHKDYTRKIRAKTLADHERAVGEQIQLGLKHYTVVRIEPSTHFPGDPEKATIYLQRVGPLE